MSTSVATTGVLINEFEQNPLGEDAGNEWVELFNPTNQAVNVSGWVLIPTRNRIHNATLQAGSIIAPLGYLIVQTPFQWLDNEWEIIVLKDTAGNTIDTTRNATDTYNDDRSWQRFPNGQDTNNDADWAFRPATKGVSNGGESIVTTTTTQQQTTTTTEQLTTTTTSTTWSATTTQRVTTSTTQVQTTTTSTQQQTTTSTSMTTSTTHQQTTTTITQQAGNFGMGFAFAVIGIGAGAAAVGVGVAVAASGPLGSGVYTYGGYYYCRKHNVPVWWIQCRLWCPADGKFLKSQRNLAF